MFQYLLIKVLHLVNVFIIISSSIKPTLGDTELRALMDIKASLDPYNRVLKTWQFDGDPCSSEDFIGVACNEHLKVANITLQGKKLTGKLSPAIGDFKNLSGLYLHYNSISGNIPKEIGKLTELTDLYLNVNNFSASLPAEIGQMTNLQVLDLCFNRLTGDIPGQLGSLSKLESVFLQHNQLNGSIPSSLGSLISLKTLNLSYNALSGPIPTSLKRLDAGFSYGNNTDLCGAAFPALRPCTAFDNSNVDINTTGSFGFMFKNNSTPKHKPNEASLQTNCTLSTCSKSTKFPPIVIVVGVITIPVSLAAAGFLTFLKYRHLKQKIVATLDTSESRISSDHANEPSSRSASPLISLAYSTGWGPLTNSFYSGDFTQDELQYFKYNMEEVQCATQYFSEGNVLGRGKFSTVYKGVLRDGSEVVVKSISMSSCQPEEAEFVKGLRSLVSLRHENLASLRGFCFSRGRGECFVIYDFAPKGNLLKYLDVSDGSEFVLPWSTRVNIINGIARGLCYLHQETPSKPSVLHQNISAEKIVIDNKYNALILDSGLRKILADDTIFSALKVSAAMGYLAPEYITTGRFTEKSDVYAYGVIVLHLISGKQLLTTAMRSVAESSNLEDFIDHNLHGKFSKAEASMLVGLGLSCIHELPDERPNTEVIVQELSKHNNGY